MISLSWLCATKASYAAVVTTKPGGTGKPPRINSPRLAPLPPARARSARPRSPRSTTMGSAGVEGAGFMRGGPGRLLEHHLAVRGVVGAGALHLPGDDREDVVVL